MPSDLKLPRLKIDGPKRSKKFVVLAHGAGQSSDSSFLTYFAEGLADLRYRVVRFDFPYMEERSTTGRKRPPNTEPVLRQTWHDVISHLDAERIAIGGKSMGGRIASLVADETDVAGVICLGYPFHPTGKPDRLRVDHLKEIQTPTLIVQGERDPFGKREEVATYSLSESIEIHWCPDGDHSLKPRKSSGRTLEENWQDALRRIGRFLFELWPE